MEKDLILLTWPDYINPLTIEQFQAAFDVKVKLEIVPSAVELIDRLREAGVGVAGQQLHRKIRLADSVRVTPARGVASRHTKEGAEAQLACGRRHAVPLEKLRKSMQLVCQGIARLR